MNRVAQECLTSLALRCKKDANSAYAAAEKEENVIQKAMLHGKQKQAAQIYHLLKLKYPVLNLPAIH